MTTRHRKRVDRLTPDERTALLLAFQALKDSKDPKTNYNFWASIHAHGCPHGSALFLYWHRAYIYAFEDALRAAGGRDTAAVTLPYWDWVRTRTIPPLLDQGPLQHPRDDDRTRPKERMLPTARDEASVLGSERFFVFGGLHCDPPSFTGSLENIHGFVHIWVGHDMSLVDCAAFDPIFWFHHANVDRLWARWQRTHPAHALCLDAPLMSVPGRTPWTARDVVDTFSPRLGYEYVEDSSRLFTRHLLSDETTFVIDAPPEADSVELILRDIRIDERGEPPAVIQVRVGEPRDLAGQVSLFGLLHGPCDPPVEIVGVEGHEHHHHAHSLNARIELTQAVRQNAPGPVSVNLIARGAMPGKPPAQVSIGEIWLAFPS
jgi:hypothetical protein